MLQLFAFATTTSQTPRLAGTSAATPGCFPLRGLYVVYSSKLLQLLPCARNRNSYIVSGHMDTITPSLARPSPPRVSRCLRNPNHDRFLPKNEAACGIRRSGPPAAPSAPPTAAGVVANRGEQSPSHFPPLHFKALKVPSAALSFPGARPKNDDKTTKTRQKVPKNAVGQTLVPPADSHPTQPAP